MSSYFISNYTVTNAVEYQKYLEAVRPTLAPFNPKVLVAGDNHTIIEGEPSPITIVLEFESREAAEGWYNSEAYQEVIGLRLDNTEGWGVIADQYQASH